MTSKNNAIAITGIISGVILIVALVYLFTLKPVTGENVVSVEGIATVMAMPDLVGVYFNIETTGDTAQEAKDSTSEILNNLVDKLVSEEGFKREEIVTESFNVYPNYRWENGKQIDEGYKASHQIRVKIPSNDSAKVGRVVDLGVESGAGISYINYELSQESQNKYKAEAMKLAAEDATVKANSVASGFGKKADKLVSVEVSDFGYYPWRAYSAGGITMEKSELDAAVSNIQPGEQEISARIVATFRLK